MTDSENPSYELYQSGRKAMEAQRYEDAIAFFDRSVEAAPHFKTLELLGECYCLLGKTKQAIVPLAAAASLNDQVRAKAMLAKVLLETGDGNRAKQLATQVVATNPDNRIAKEVLAATKDIEI